MKKINVIWLVNEKFTNNFLSFYKLCNQKNSKINITIFAVPHIGLTSSKEISEYLSANGIDNIDCYNKSTKQYVDIKKYKPDYVFYTTPYNIYVPDDYKSKIVSKYAKVCCVSYGACVIRTNGLYKDLSKNTFIDDCYKIFVESKYSMLHSNKNKYKILGYMKLDNYTDIQENLRKKVIWKPRWTLEEGDSNFFEYFDCLYNYFVNHPDFDFSIYFHPLFESKIREKKYEEKFEECLTKLSKLKNYIRCNDSEFLSDILDSSVLISDHSSTMAEFFTTGNPIIYCETKTKLNKLGKKIIKYSYKVNNKKKLIKKLNYVLYNNDYKKKFRQKNKNKLFFVPTTNNKVAKKLYDYLINDS